MFLAVVVDDFSEAGHDEDVVEGEAGEFAGEEFDLRADVEVAIEDETAFAPDGAQAAGAVFQGVAQHTDGEAFGQGFKFLEKLGVGHLLAVACLRPSAAGGCRRTGAG